MRIPSTKPINRRNSLWVPWFVLWVGVVVTILAAWYVRHSAALREQARFQGLADAAVDQLNGAVDDYAVSLRGASGLFAAFGTVSANQFDAYITEQNLPLRFPAMRALGYAPRVPAEKIPDVQALGRREVIADYHIWPMKGQSEAYPVLFVEPRDATITRPGLGFDVMTEPTRAAAIRRARDTATAAASDKAHLLAQTDSEQTSAFVICIPVFTGGKTPPTVELRRKLITGVVFAGFRVDDFFNRVFDSEVRDRLQIAVFNKTDTGSTEQLYDPSRFALEPAGFVPHLHETRMIKFAGRTWTLQMSERADFDVESGNPLTIFILLGGFGISLVLFAVTRSQALSQDEAERSAAALRRSSEAIRASQSRLRRLVDSNLIGVFFCNTDGKIIDGNGEFFRLVGRSREQAVSGESLSFQTVITSDQLDSQLQALRQLGQTGVWLPRETALLRPDGTHVPVLIGLAMVDGSKTEAVAFTVDLTQRKQAERDLQSAKDAAEAANRSKDQFLAVLSHELRTPLTPVLAMTTASRDDRRLPPEVRNDFAMIHRNVELEAKLIDDLLDLTRIGRGKLQLHLSTVDLHQVIRAAIEVCSSSEIAAKNLVVESDLSARFHYLNGDAARLQQVFWNLLKNAIKFSPRRSVGGAKIVIRTRNDPADSSDLQTGSIVVDVIDQGIGIEADVLPRIFDAFEQGTAARAQASGGLGLGLAISRGLVEAHGGHIWADSKGTTFTVRLPAVAPMPEVAAANDRSPRPDQSAPLRILLVEDHVDTAAVLARLLRHDGHAVEVAGCVADANRLALEQSFDLLLSDLGLPDGSGIDVIQCFRNRQDGIERFAIALTGFGAETDVLRTTTAGFDDHLTKPISYKDLQQAIARVVSGANQSPVY
jgi:PAS domain S-box-containing protein